MKLGTPLPLKVRYYDRIEKEIRRLFFHVLFEPLALALGSAPGAPTKDARTASLRFNAAGDALLAALRTGRVWYDNGIFRGDFNARISNDLRRAGATWNHASGTFSQPLAKLPGDVRTAIGEMSSYFDKLKRDVLQTLDEIDVASIAKQSRLKDRYTESIEWQNDDFQKAVKAISIPPKLTRDMAANLATGWSRNLELYIQKFTQEKIFELRDLVQQNAFAGKRPTAMIDVIKHQYGVSQNKAKFLARQETALLKSKFHEQRYKAIGITRYRWSTSHDARVRHDHEDLQGKIFSWDNPPVVDRRTGRRANPGEDYNCRCIAIPIID